MNAYYDLILRCMHNVLGNDATYTDDLDQLGRRMLGTKFRGVFPIDKVPSLTPLSPYAIVNMDHSGLPGSHWIAFAYDWTCNRLVIYDSFGRPLKDIMPRLKKIYGRVVTTDEDPEQRLKEENCGQRCLAWLYLFEKRGVEEALTI